MDAAVTSVAMAALVADGILAGLSLDKVIVQLPARRRIGVTAYAAYARAADLGNGIAFYAGCGCRRRGADPGRVRRRRRAWERQGR